MTTPTLVMGTRNYSSWSLRPWLLARHLSIPLEERVLHFGSEEFASEIARLSPSRKVPVLLHDGACIWESLAICEYLSELAHGRGWPQERARRAQARAVAAEMHAGFPALRSQCPMNARAVGRRVAATAALARDLQRIEALWADCRAAAAGKGPWLFGDYSAADAMYSPVVLRIHTYGLALSGAARDYHEHCLRDSSLREWIALAEVEGVRVEEEEVGEN